MKYRPAARIEVLESRIAPAVFFVSAATDGENALKVFKGSDVAGGSEAELAALTFTEADAAVLLKKGDTLVFDADGDRTLSEGDTVMLKVTGGSAMVLLSDLAVGGTAGGFDLNEITGLVVSNKFKGSLKVDVTGSVVTGLDGTGKVTGEGFTLTLQDAGISQLTSEGQIVGNVLAGGSISKLTVGEALTAGSVTDLSVGGVIATGTAAGFQSISLDGGSKFVSVAFEQKAGKAGGNITGVTLATGVTSILAGDGGSKEKGKAGNGGSVRDVSVIAGTNVLFIDAGDGGEAGKGKGGAGGAISDIRFTAAEGESVGLDLNAGSGGLTENGVGGGAGGSISKITFLQESGTAVVDLTAGSAAFDTKGKAAAGSVSSVTINADTITSFELHAGNGAAGPLLGASGDGGSVSKISVAGELTAGLTIGGGAGGSGISAGKGGSLTKVDLMVTGIGTIEIVAGGGGTAIASKPGAGGALKDVKVNTGGDFQTILLSGGQGGSIFQGDGKRNVAGHGGSVSKVAITNSGTIDLLNVISGEGGYIFTGAGTGGNSGSVSDVSIINSGVLDNARVHSGFGGSLVLVAIGDGGSSGNVSNVSIEDTNEMEVNSYSVYAGFPTDAFSGPGKGDIFGGSSKAYAAMSGGGVNSKGGNIGKVSGVDLETPGADVTIGADGKAGTVEFFIPGVGPGVPSGPVPIPGTAGKGGDIEKIKGSVGTLTILAPGGGDALGGTGGAGGSVRNVDITEVTNFVHIIAAGDGGLSQAGGNGGSIEKVSIAGDIGNFNEEFGFDLAAPSMGGLAAGKAGGISGAAGSIKNITADRIAAIVAGRPVNGLLSYINAVSSISGVVANEIGADLDGTGFSFTEVGSNPGFQPDELGTSVDGDIAIDGLVLVLADSNSVVPANVLKVVQVPSAPLIL